MSLHDHWNGNSVKLINRNGSEITDKGNEFNLADEKVGAIFDAKADVTEIFITPSLFNNVFSFYLTSSMRHPASFKLQI